MRSFLVILTCSLFALSIAEGDPWHEPTTRSPTTRAPSTRAPTTRAPTTHAPTTHAPTTTAPDHGHGHGGHGGHGGHPVPPSPFPDEFYTKYELANLNVTRTLYNGLLYPSAQNIIDSGTYPPGLFNNQTAGRITPVGDFDDPIGSFEYFYGLAASSKIQRVSFIQLFAKGNIVVVRVDLLFNNTNSLQNLTQVGFITFDENNLINSYDLNILRLGEAVPSPPDENLPTIDLICEVHQEFCLGANQQYASYDACVTEISTINFGTWYNAASNTTVCRQLHSILVPLRPDFHCPHIGPTGGSACVDVPYAAYYDQYF